MLRGFLPARFGTQRQAPQLRPCLTLSWDAVAVFPYYSSDALHDKLVIIRSNATVYTTALTPGAYAYNPYNGKQHVTLTLAAPGLVSFTTGTLGASTEGARAIQFKDELIIMTIEGRMVRYSVNTAGTQSINSVGVGIPVLGVPALLDGGSGGALSAGTYKYAITQEDNRGRESSPSFENTANQELSITLVAGHKVTVGPGGIIPGGGGVTGPAIYNVYRTVANGATFLFAFTTATFPATDNTADADLGDAAPEPGENDVPESATFGAVYRNRLVLNDISLSPLSTQEIQISNADSPTQFSVLTLPENPSDGLTINCGTDTGDQVTGLANLGSLLAIFMRRSIKLLQGSDGTDFEVVEIHKRGGVNQDSIVRAENVIPFLSSDGVYEIAYGSGIQDRKISLDIEDFFTDQADTVGNGNESDLVIRILAAATAGRLFGWYFGNIYYLSLPMQTICYDLISEGWSQTGWPLISSACVYAQAGVPDTSFVLQRTNAAVKPRQIHYFTATQRWDDPDAAPFSNSEEISRLFDGGGPPSERVKKAVRFSLWGSSAKPNGTAIGTFTLYTDQGYTSEPYPVIVGQVTSEASALFQVEFPDDAVGRHIWFRIWINDPSYTGSDRMLEYTSYDVD